ncbi:tRNA/rRNA methyltransferase [Pectobacterium sp. B1J-3]|uniref:tRNA/rRNA methyltransferase n=1 Tax=Pectobacterium sp. B1J-3 TaxID=3385371 RepID=UPI003906C463
MSDSFESKSGKVRVMYVRSDDEGEKENKKKRPEGNEGRGGRAGSRDKREKPQHPRDTNPRYARENPLRGGESREKSPWGKGKERNERSGDRSRRPRDESVAVSDSPWKTVSRAPGDEAELDHGGISGKSQIDPEQIRRQRQEETRVYGENACHALFKSRPEAIVRAWFLQEVTPRFRDALRWMAANRKAYHVVEDDELTKASGTEHHGGVCFLIKKRQGLDVREYLKTAGERDCVLALEDVDNPHSLGGIMRTCAHFGVKGVLIQDVAQLESGAAVRTAEGGAEHVKAINADDFLSVLGEFRRAGYTIVTISNRKGAALSGTVFPAKTVMVLGQEGDGLSDSAWQQGDVKVSIDGTGKVESLNISVTTGILLSEWWRHNQA